MRDKIYVGLFVDDTDNLDETSLKNLTLHILFTLCSIHYYYFQLDYKLNNFVV